MGNCSDIKCMKSTPCSCVKGFDFTYTVSFNHAPTQEMLLAIDEMVRLARKQYFEGKLNSDHGRAKEKGAEETS